MPYQSNIWRDAIPQTSLESESKICRAEPSATQPLRRVGDVRLVFSTGELNSGWWIDVNCRCEPPLSTNRIFQLGSLSRCCHSKDLFKRSKLLGTSTDFTRNSFNSHSIRFGIVPNSSANLFETPFENVSLRVLFRFLPIIVFLKRFRKKSWRHS